MYDLSANIKCLKCESLLDLGGYVNQCQNCGQQGTWISGKDSRNVKGFFCSRCNKGRTNWSCSCGCDNLFRDDWLIETAETKAKREAQREAKMKAKEAKDARENFGGLLLFAFLLAWGIFCCKEMPTIGRGIAVWIFTSIFIILFFCVIWKKLTK